MHVEACCQALLAHFLPRTDRLRRGWALDIGVGTFAFYCKLFARLGYRTLAVEPLPVQPVHRLCRQWHIALEEACLTDQVGETTLYLGEFDGERSLNVSSVHADWWGSSTDARSVPSVDLPELLRRHAVRRITCMKVDVEGGEYTIIKQLPALTVAQVPACLMFEYGGGAERKTGRAGWSHAFLDRTLKALQVLRDVGYEQALMVDKGLGQIRHLNLQRVSLEGEALFPPQSEYGNLIALRHTRWSDQSVRAVGAAFRSDRIRRKVAVPEVSVLARLIAKARRTLK